MTDIEKRLSELRNQQGEATRRLAQAEAKRDQVIARRTETLEALKEMGYDTPEAAQEAAVALNNETESILAQIEEKVAGL